MNTPQAKTPCFAMQKSNAVSPMMLRSNPRQKFDNQIGSISYIYTEFRLCSLSFTPLKALFPTSYELIMMAQAGATFNVLGIHPLNSPDVPSVLKICHRKRGIDCSSGARTLVDVAADVTLSLKT